MEPANRGSRVGIASGSFVLRSSSIPTHCRHLGPRHNRLVTHAFLLALVLGLSPPVDHPKTFLASIRIDLLPDERIDAFKIETWGVEFKAVCNIPNDWEITAGSFGPGGRLEGAAGHGASWLRVVDLEQLRALVLVRLVAPVQKRDIRDATGVVPATFQGFASIQSYSTERGRKRKLTFANVRLTPAKSCPSLR